MDAGTIAKRYACALLRFAQKHGEENAVSCNIATLLEGYVQYPSLHRIVCDRVLDNQRKEAIILAFFGNGISAAFKRFVSFVVMQNREAHLPLICLDYQHLYRQAQKQLTVQLTSAVPLHDDTFRQLTEKLQHITGATVSLQTHTNPALLGGFVVYWDTYRLDASVVTKLKRIQKRLTEKMN